MSNNFTERARTVLGDIQVQGVDYAYTLQGLMKGVNATQLDPTHDMGQDGGSGVNSHFAYDATGYSLGYFTDDYSAISTSRWTQPNRFEASIGSSNLETSRKHLFNGNISHMVTTMLDPVVIEQRPKN
jgi:hypothetical protein